MVDARRVSLSLFITLIMTTTAFVVLASAPAAAAQPALDGQDDLVQGAPDLGELQRHSSYDPNGKLDQALRDQLKSTTGKLKVHVFVSDVGAANEFFADRGLPKLTRNVDGMPLTAQLMELDAKQIGLMAESPSVIKITAFREITYEAPEVFDEVPEEADLRVFEDLDVDDVHGAVEAWNEGWTGEDVMIAVLDTGFDMAHPDLQGQQARYSSGPYAGWPIAYDDLAAVYWSMDMVGSWVADTSTVVSPYGDYVYFDGQRYKVGGLTDVLGNPLESQSDLYRIGYHPDVHLYALWGGWAAVLVVDSTTPGVYDTVYVDVTHDFDFTNDKACMMGDEISYFDSYNSTSGVDNYTMWNSGDGFADYSGGMVYWISDGVNVLPASDWLWGASFIPTSGEAVAFMGEFSYGQSHGTMTASAALATNESFGGALVGMAPGAKLVCVPLTYDYYASWLFAMIGADGAFASGDEAHIVSNSYGFSSTAVNAAFDEYDMFNLYYSALAKEYVGSEQLWFWSTGNGGPGYGTVHSVMDYTSVHVGAGTTQQYRYLFGYEQTWGNQKWGDVAPFSNSGPGRNGKLNAEIIASGMYSVNPAPLNQPWYGGLGDGYMHFQIGSGTSHATPTAAGGAALGYDAFMDSFPGMMPPKDYAKAQLMASSDDMHFDPLKQGSGWLNASRFAWTMSEQLALTSLAYPTFYGGGEPGYMKAAIYPGTVYDISYEFYPNFLYPGQYDDNHTVSTWNIGPEAAEVTITSELLIRTGNDLITVVTADDGDVYEDITGFVPATTDLLKVTMFLNMAEFDPDMDYMTDVGYMLEMHDWVDLDSDSVMNTSGSNWELFRYSVDGSDCNYNQIMLKDPISRTTDGLIARIRSVSGAEGVTVHLQLDYYEFQTFPWIQLRELGDTSWTPSLSLTVPSGYSSAEWEVNVSVPSDAPVGTYAAAIYVDDGTRAQCIPVVINVASAEYEFEFGGTSYFDTPYNNDFTGIADKGWRFEVGDWRMYWSVPTSATIPASDMVVFVNWTELPTDVNVHVLYPEEDWYWGMYSDWELPWGGPGVYMVAGASSDEMYMGSGTFGVKTSTGGPQEVLYAWSLGDLESSMISTFGRPQPYAIVTRCAVMSGSAASDTLSGYTQWSDVTGWGISPGYTEFYAEQPGSFPLSDTIEDFGVFGLSLTTEMELTAGGMGPYQYESWPMEEVYPDSMYGSFEETLANAWYTEYITLEGASLVSLEIGELWDAPDLDLGIWFDENGNGMPELTEPFWYSAGPTAEESLNLVGPEDGNYIIKVLGYTVSAYPGYFWMELVSEISGGYVFMEGVPETAPIGLSIYEFNVTYSLPERAGTYLCRPSFGFYGLDNVVWTDVVFEVVDVGAPVIEDVSPADGEVVDTTMPTISFTVNDHVEFYSGIDPYSVGVYLDDWFWFGSWDMGRDGDTFILALPFVLDQGPHTATFTASDNYGNEADPVTVTFTVNSVIETFTAEFAEVGMGAPIEDGSTVAATQVSIFGETDPYADVWVSSPAYSHSTVSDGAGHFELDPVDLVEGVNVFTLVTTNDAAVTETIYKTIISDTECMLTVNPVSSPTAHTSITLSGLTDPGATVRFDGDPATVGPGGAWTYEAALAEGTNVFLVEATDPVGNGAWLTVTVVRDTTAPALEIDSPADGATVSEASVLVEGTTEAGAMVFVNGVLASDGSTAWSATVVLAEGDNTITVTAEDALGNSVTEAVSVTYEPPVYVTPDELDEVQQDLDDTQLDLDDTQQDLQGQVDDADSFAMMLMYIIVILFIVSVILSLVLWNNLRGKMGGGGSSHSMEEVEHEPPAPSEMEREFEEFGKEMDKS